MKAMNDTPLMRDPVESVGTAYDSQFIDPRYSSFACKNASRKVVYACSLKVTQMKLPGLKREDELHRTGRWPDSQVEWAF
jgi:hypothetical protein